MRSSLSLKTLLRAPFKTFLTYLLIAAASFGLFYRVTDYAVTQREMERATSYYRGVAAIDNGVQNTAVLLASQLPNTVRYSYYKDESPPTSPLTAEQMSAFSSLPGVSATETRYMTAGIIDGLNRIVDYGPYTVKWDYTARFVIEATYAGYTPVKWGGSMVNQLQLTDCKPLVDGLPMSEGVNASIIATADDGAESFYVRDMRGFYYIVNNPFGTSFVKELEIGERYLFIGRWDPRNYSVAHTMDLYLGDQDIMDYCDMCWPLAGKPDNYLETDEFAKVRKVIEITNQDLKTFDVVYTSDMYSIPRFSERKMVIQEGRALTEQDTNACVVNLALLDVNGLKIGDKITVKLCDKLLPQHSEIGTTAVIPDRLGTPVKTVQLEIVGAYTDTDAQYERDAAAWWCYSPNTIFVPQSLLPVDVPVDYEIRPGEFSIVIDDALQIEDFLNEAEPLKKELGVTLRFSDAGWMKIKDSMDISKSGSLVTTVLYIAAAAIALLLSTYLYIGREKKNYAIMRALGTPRKKAQSSLALPLAVLSAIAIPVGGIGGMIYATKAIRTALEKWAELIEQYTPDTSLPTGAVILCLICEVAFLLLLSALFLTKLAKTPPLALLQGDTSRTKQKKRKAQVYAEQTESIPDFVLSFPISSGLPQRGVYSSGRHVVSYLLRHMRRAGWKTTISVLLAVMLTGAIGLLAVTRLSYREMFNKTVVMGTLNNFPSSSVMEVQHSDLVEDFYYSGKSSVICNNIPDGAGYLFALTNDIERYLQSRYTTPYTIEYAEGYDASIFQTNEAVCLVGNSMANIYGIKAGDTVQLLSWDRYDVLETMCERDDELFSKLRESSRTFKVAGIITSEDQRLAIGAIPVSIFAPLSTTAEEISPYGEYPFPIEYCELKLIDNEDPYELRDYLSKLASADTKYMEAVTYDLDTTELENIRRIRDMLNLLFPIAVAAAVVIGMIAPGLIILQSAKEAATLRVLGTTKLRTRCMLAIEQTCLCVIGLIIAALGLLIYNPGLFIRCSGTLALCGSLYLLGGVCAAIVAAYSVTRRRAVELLQVKE